MPIIGVVALADTPWRDTYQPPYLEALARAGAEPRLLPWTTDPAQLAEYAGGCGGVLFTGGNDLDPARYGEQKLPCCGEVTPERDAFELALLALLLPRETPVLAICRGLQTINVALGGTLWQDIPAQTGSQLEHQPSPSARIKEPVHEVSVAPESRLFPLLGGSHAVNSMHHQGIKALAPSLRAAATAPDGIVEAFELPQHPFLLGVQWHPEHLAARFPAQQAIFDLFVRACR